MHVGKRCRAFYVLSICCFAVALFLFALIPTAVTAYATGGESGAKAAERDESIMQTYRPGLSLVNAPTVVLDVTGKASLDSISSCTRKPSNAIVRFDGNCNVVSDSGETLGRFADVYATVLKPNNVIPVIKISDGSAADAAINFLGEEMDLLDVAVMSDVPALVKKVRSTNRKIRGIISYPSVTALHDLVSVTNSSYANVAVIPQSMATAENVRYVHARFKTVWVVPDSKEKFDLYDCIGSGAYGIVTDDFDSVYDVLTEYDAQDGLVRTPFNVGHRGVPNVCNENSVSGTREAIDAGATHVELDAYITTDNEIVFSHDREIARTTDGTGDIESYTLSQLREFNLDLFIREPIPTFEDITNVLKGSEVILVLEIKSTKDNFVETLRKKIDECGFWEQMVVISFEHSILADMKIVLPEIPTADLNSVYTDNFAEMLASYGELNTGVDTQYVGGDGSFNENYLRDRGFVGWYWTFDNLAKMMIADNSGYVGLTNNCPENFAYYTMSVTGKETYGKKTVNEGDDITVLVTDYTGEQREDIGKVFKCEDCGDHIRVVAVYGRYYTQSFKIYKNEQAAPKKKGCGSAAYAAGGTVGACLFTALGVAFCAVRKKRLPGRETR